MANDHDRNLTDLAHDMFIAYNLIADDYDLPQILTQQELRVVLEDNFTERQIIKLLHDERAQFVLAGQIAAFLTIDDLQSTLIVVEGIEGAGDNDILTLINEAGDVDENTKKSKKPTTH